MELKIVFNDDNYNDYYLYFKIEENPISFLWIKKLKQLSNKKINLESRWCGFSLRKNSNLSIIQKLKENIKLINNSFLNHEYDYYIDPISNDYTTEEHNRIHNHFEILMGQTLKPSVFYHEINKRGDINLLNAIRGLNDLSHEIEENKMNLPHLINCFIVDNINRELLPQHADDYFMLGNYFGYIFLHYAQVGKSWIDFLYDNDREISVESIKPLQIISGEFDICFSDDVNPYTLQLANEQEKQNMYDSLKFKLKQYNKDINDKSLRLGRIKVAEIIIKDESKEDILKNLAIYHKMKALHFIENNKIIFSNIF